MRRAARQAEQAISSPAGEMEEEKDPLMAADGLPLALPPVADTVGAVPAATESAVERRRRLVRDGSRRRRRRVAALYAELRAMIPAIPSARRRATKEEVVAAAAARVKELEGAAAALEARREAAAASVAVTFSARLPTPAPAGALRRVVEAVERRGARVLLATLARLGDGGEGGCSDVVVTITVAAAAPEVVEMIRADIAGIN